MGFHYEDAASQWWPSRTLSAKASNSHSFETNMNAIAETQQHAETELHRRDMTEFPFWTLLAIYALARVLQVYSGSVPMLSVVALHVLPPAIFAVIHGARGYR